jgi:hypothetical protein
MSIFPYTGEEIPDRPAEPPPAGYTQAYVIQRRSKFLVARDTPRGQNLWSKRREEWLKPEDWRSRSKLSQPEAERIRDWLNESFYREFPQRERRQCEQEAGRSP